MTKVTVITPTYSGKYVEQTIDSVFAQTKKPDEYIICVDGNFETFEKVRKYVMKKGETHRLLKTEVKLHFEKKSLEKVFGEGEGDFIVSVLYRKENKGIGASLNDCIERSTGDLILWISADDIMDLNRVKESIEHYERQLQFHPDGKFILHSNFEIVGKDSKHLYHHKQYDPSLSQEELRVRVLRACIVNFSTSAIPRAVFDTCVYPQEVLKDLDVGEEWDGKFYCADKRFGEDYEFLLRASLAYQIPIYLYPSSWCKYRSDPSKQVTSKKMSQISSNDDDSRKRVFILKGYLEDNKNE